MCQGLVRKRMGVNLGIENIIEFLVLLGQQCLCIEHNCVSARVYLNGTLYFKRDIRLI